MTLRPVSFALLLVLFVSLPGFLSSQEKDGNAQDKIFSGPQVGEKLPGFKLKLAHGEQAGKEKDPVADAAGKPVIIVFVHERTRPAFGLTNVVMKYCDDQKVEHRAVCFLSSDQTEAFEWLSRIKNYFPKGTPVGISPDGQDGPGAMGLNRNVALTILVAKDNKIAGNFAMVQPSIQEDGGKILSSIAKAIEAKEKPNLEKYLARGNQRMRMNPQLVQKVRKLFAENVSDEEVGNTIKEIEKMVEKRKPLQAQLGQLAKRFISSSRIDSITNKTHQETIKQWAKKYGSMEAPNRGNNARGKDGRQNDAKLTGMLRSLIQKSNSDEEVDKIAKSIEDYVEKNQAARAEVARISKTIAGSDRLTNYGTERCQEILKKWAEKYNK